MLKFADCNDQDSMIWACKFACRYSCGSVDRVGCVENYLPRDHAKRPDLEILHTKFDVNKLDHYKFSVTVAIALNSYVEKEMKMCSRSNGQCDVISTNTNNENQRDTESKEEKEKGVTIVVAALGYLSNVANCPDHRETLITLNIEELCDRVLSILPHPQVAEFIEAIKFSIAGDVQGSHVSIASMPAQMGSRFHGYPSGH